MPRGGARPNSGPKKGSKYRKRGKPRAEKPMSSAAPPSAEAEREQTARIVALCVHDGMSEADTAAAIGMAVEAMREAFAVELAHGKALIRADVLRRLDEQASDGKVAATRALLDARAKDAPEAPAAPGSSTPASELDDKLVRGALKILSGGKK